MKRIVVSLLALLGGCAVSPPEGVRPVEGFEVSRYLGGWHEIARLDHSFERGLVAVTATYSPRADGSLKVVNRGFDPKSCTWREAEGRAKFTGAPETGQLKVSFFGPFYSGYTIFALDRQDYRWALVSGPNRDYLWILARDAEIPADLRERLLAEARALGFATDRLIWVSHEVPPC